MKTFVTLFNSQNVHLIKDVGLIPYGMYRFENYESYIATYNNGDYGHLQDAVKGLKLWFVKKYTGNFTIDSVAFLLKNSKKIDVLNLYHTTFRSAVFSLVYKRINPNGKIYLKLDGGYTQEETPWYKAFRRYAMCRADLVTTELKETRGALIESWHRQIGLLRNPYHPADLKKYMPYFDRSNTILTVGRIGTSPKNTVTLLKAFLSVSDKIPNWNLLLVGPVESSFRQQLEDLFDHDSSLKQRVVLYGNVESRDELMQLYRTVKVFVFPSRWESYGIALMEAGLCGTFQMCSELPASKELTNDFEYAVHFPAEDVNSLSELLEVYCTADNFEMECKAKKEREYIIENCSLEQVCGQLNKMIDEI